MMDLPLLAAGRTADVYALDEEWVLRRMRDGTSTEAESAIMSHVTASGFPVPRQMTRTTDLNPGDQVLERLSGPTMAEAMITGTFDARAGAALLAELLRNLHAIPARVSADPDVRILHLDLHPENVIITARGPVVIDWTNATEGPPGVDCAMSALILAQVAITMAPPHDIAVRTMLAAFLEELTKSGGIRERDLSVALERRGSDPSQTSAERGLLRAAADMVRA